MRKYAHMLKPQFLAIVSFLLLVGCNAQLVDYVREAGPGAGGGGGGDATAPTGRNTVRISPGSVIATGGGIATRATVSTTGQVLSGGGLSTRVSINQFHPQ